AETVDPNLFVDLFDGTKEFEQSSGDHTFAESQKLIARLVAKYGLSVVDIRYDAQGNRIGVVNERAFRDALFKQTVVLAEGTRLVFDEKKRLEEIANTDGSKIRLIRRGDVLTGILFTQANGKRVRVDIDAPLSNAIRVPDAFGRIGGRRSDLAKAAALPQADFSDPAIFRDLRALEAAVKNTVAYEPFVQQLTLKSFKESRFICTADIPISACSGRTQLVFESSRWLYSYEVASAISPRGGTANYASTLLSRSLKRPSFYYQILRRPFSFFQNYLSRRVRMPIGFSRLIPVASVTTRRPS
ncbi:MAG: hypothetical protein HYZ87_03940, partial [Candidatus Omnitrophica bacterium]|nr:hypothetical protein [Candidatus Omnitrophota bacterium]